MNREVEYFIQNFKQMLLFCKEFKMNTIFQIFNQVVYFFVYYLFFDVLSSVVVGLEYSKLELFVYLILIDMCVTFWGMFDWGKPLKRDIPTGKLNLYVCRPLNPFYLYQFSRLNSNAFIQHMTAWIILISILYFSTINLEISLLSISLFLLVLFYYGLIRVFCNVIAFFNFALSDILYHNVFRAGSSSFKQYPAQFFEFFPYKRFLIIFPMYFMGALFFEYALFEQFEMSLLISLIVLNIVTLSITIILWKFGLKKYEAYG